jgi:membrane protein required for colicin V production
MNLMDIGLIAVMAIGFVAGIGLGFLRLVLPFAAAVAVWAALRFQPEVAVWLKAYLKPELAHLLAYIVVAIGALILVGLLGAALHVFVKITLMGWLDRLVGVVAGLAVGIVLAALLVKALDAFGGPEIQELLAESVLAEPLRKLLALGLKELEKYRS